MEKSEHIAAIAAALLNFKDKELCEQEKGGLISMKCHYCGSPMKKKDRFCNICGRRPKTVSLKDDNMSSVKSVDAVGLSAGNAKTAQYIVEDVDRFITPRGHGFAAEKMNDYWDKAHARDAKVVGGNNLKDGPDRVVDGINIQTKYCKTGSKCIGECFEGGRFRYLNADGSPMQIEVPSDKYDDAVKAMESRIQKGEVPGITDPAEAKNIVRKGNFTYEQARNVARFGTVESLTYDAVQGTVIASYAFGLSAAMNFAIAVWNGKDFDDALKSSASAGLKVGGATFVTSVLASQMQKTALNSLLRGTTDQIVKIMGPTASAWLANAFRSGANISGAAAMQSASKLLRGNIVTGAITVAVLSSFDVANVFRGRISGKQLFKNISQTAATVAGGTVGWMAGAATGAAIGSIIPGIGTAIGGFLGGLAGSFGAGSVAGKAASSVLDDMIEDDAVEMQAILEREFKVLAEEYLITGEEAVRICDNLKNIVDGDFLKDMFADDSRAKYARTAMEPLFENVARERPIIKLPTNKEMVDGLRSVLEEMADKTSQTQIAGEGDRNDPLSAACELAEKHINELDKCKKEIASRELKDFFRFFSSLDDDTKRGLKEQAKNISEEAVSKDNRKSIAIIWDKGRDDNKRLEMLEMAVQRAEIQNELIKKMNLLLQKWFSRIRNDKEKEWMKFSSLNEEEKEILMNSAELGGSLVKLLSTTVFDDRGINPEFDEKIKSVREVIAKFN